MCLVDNCIFIPTFYLFFLHNFILNGLHEIIEIPLGANFSANFENMYRHDSRVQFHKIVFAAPQKMRSANQVVHLVGIVGMHSEFGNRKVQPAAVSMVGIECDHY